MRARAQLRVSRNARCACLRMCARPGFRTCAHARARADAAPTERLALAVEIRDGIEIVHSSEYINFLKHFFPAFAELLNSTPLASEDGPAHRLRNVVLEVLSRMPQNEVRRVHLATCATTHRLLALHAGAQAVRSPAAAALHKGALV